MLNDPAEKNGRDRNCGPACTRHTLTVTSEVGQTIWIGAHTYRYYSYADGDQCPSHTDDPLLNKLGKTKAPRDSRMNMIFNNKAKSATAWQAGDVWLPPMVVFAGEQVTIEVELNWNRPGITKDWSVTVWGEDGVVAVTHDGGIPSDSLPYQPKAGSLAAKRAAIYNSAHGRT